MPENFIQMQSLMVIKQIMISGNLNGRNFKIFFH